MSIEDIIPLGHNIFFRHLNASITMDRFLMTIAIVPNAIISNPVINIPQSERVGISKGHSETVISK